MKAKYYCPSCADYEKRISELETLIVGMSEELRDTVVQRDIANHVLSIARSQLAALSEDAKRLDKVQALALQHPGNVFVVKTDGLRRNGRCFTTVGRTGTMGDFHTVREAIDAL